MNDATLSDWLVLSCLIGSFKSSQSQRAFRLVHFNFILLFHIEYAMVSAINNLTLLKQNLFYSNKWSRQKTVDSVPDVIYSLKGK
jgi:hypothetical protein